MRRAIVLITVLLLAGAIVNVAVAWECVWQGDVQAQMRSASTSDLALLDRFRLGPVSDRCLFRACDYHACGYDGNFVYHQRCAGHGGAVGTVQAGLPLHSLCGYIIYPHDSSSKPATSGIVIFGSNAGNLWSAVPVVPRWPYFAVNTVFYASVLWLLFFAPARVWQYSRRRRRLCPACAYPIGTSEVCTECGKPLRRSR